MDAGRSTSYNFVVNFLLEENYLLSAFELLHELLEDGRGDQAIRLREFFSDPTQFPPDQISRSVSLRASDPQTLLDEKVSLEEKLAVAEYELRLAQEDILNLKSELLKKNESSFDKSNGQNVDVTMKNGLINKPVKKSTSFTDLEPLKDNERFDINHAVKEYLISAGYRLTAMTFYEEVTDQDLDVWQNSSACIRDALRQYYYHYLSSTSAAAEEKIGILRENGKLKSEKESLLKSKEASDGQIITLTKSLEALKKDVKDKDNRVQSLKKTLKSQRKELNECRAEITSLKMYIEGSHSRKNSLSVDSSQLQLSSLENQNEEMKHHQNETEAVNIKSSLSAEPTEPMEREEGNKGEGHKVEAKENDTGLVADLLTVYTQVVKNQVGDETSTPLESVEDVQSSPAESGFTGKRENFLKREGKPSSDIDHHTVKSESFVSELTAENMGVGTIQILADALPKIVPYVLINHREELLPLIMCTIERHPDSVTRDYLTHTLFNLIKRPDEQQRRVIMNACVNLAKNIGELRTETELLPQCWEQINHMYEERRLLVAQSCGELAEFVRPEIRDSLILSIVQQLIEDSATVIREASAHNLTLLLPLFPNTEKYFKVEEMMFQLVCDPSGTVVETTKRELVPALIKWGNDLDHILQVILSQILSLTRSCPPLSGVEASIESHIRVLGERECWNVEVLLRLLSDLLSHVYQKAIETCPFPEVSDSSRKLFDIPLLELYARGNQEWPAFEWLHVDCFPCLISLASLLSPKEEILRNCIAKFLLAVTTKFGEAYLKNIMLPVFLVAVGDDADLKNLPSNSQPKIRDLKPQTAMARRLATVCILPLFLAGVLGHSSQVESFTTYLKNLLIESSVHNDQLVKQDLIHSFRFICAFEEHHHTIFTVLWELIVSSNANFKIYAADLLKVTVPFIDAKIASIHVIPALVTLGSDQNTDVKYASINAFGVVAQHFKSDMIVDKICIQMDACLDDGTLEATIAVVRALGVSVPYTSDKLRSYLLSKIFQLTTSRPYPSFEVQRRRELANAFCESIRALDAAADLPSSSVRDFLIPAIQNLLKDNEALDPPHKEALEIILKERTGATDPTKGLASHFSSLFGESGLLLAKVENAEGPSSPEAVEARKGMPLTPGEDTRFRRIMRGSFTDMLRPKQ